MSHAEFIYDMWKGETYIDSGTATELAKKYHVKRETMLWRATPASKKRDKGNSTVLYRAEMENSSEY